MNFHSVLAGKARGAIGFALTFGLLFLSGKKVTEQNDAPQGLLKTNDYRDRL